jgi:outer membrane protein TolC
MESLAVIRKMLELTDRQVELGTRLIELTRSNFEEGFLLETEYRDTRNRIQQILLTQTALKNQRQDLLLNLRQVTGLKNLEMDNLMIPAVDDSLESYVIGTPDELIASAWMVNPDIRTLSAMEEMARAELALASGSLAVKPDVAFRTEFGYGGGFDRAPDDIDGTWTLTLGAVSTLVDSGRSRSGIRSAQADLNAAGSRSESGRREVETFIRSTLYSMSLNRENAAYYSGLKDTDTARAVEKRSSWEAGYGREEEWLLAELDSLASELSRYREVLLFIRSDRQVRRAAGILTLGGSDRP